MGWAFVSHQGPGGSPLLLPYRVRPTLVIIFSLYFSREDQLCSLHHVVSGSPESHTGLTGRRALPNVKKALKRGF